MLADDRHLEVGGTVAAERAGKRIPVKARGDGSPARLREHVAPAGRRDAPALDVGARKLAPVIEQLGISFLQRAQLGLDERVDVAQQGCEVRGNRPLQWGL
jgi:hypothetical protein